LNITIRVDGVNETLAGLEREIDQVQSFILEEFRRQVIPRTPIDTGQARRGWQTRQNSVENRVPYIERLERGWSKQAPTGFVNQAISATIDKTKRIIK
jgi:hypothetical protein